MFHGINFKTYNLNSSKLQVASIACCTKVTEGHTFIIRGWW